MAFVKLKIPTLAREVRVDEKPLYYLRPLFVEYPVASHRRFESAVSQLQREIKHFFKGYVLDRDNADQLLWYLFNPELNYRQFAFSFNLGNQLIEGRFSVVDFELQGRRFVLLPNLNNFMFIARNMGKGKKELEQEVLRVVRELLRQIKSDEGNDFDPAAYYSGRREFITLTEVSINVGQGAFKFEQVNEHWFFSRLAGETDFDGAVEIEKVAIDLNGLYPAELQRAFYREERSALLYRTVFQEENTSIALVGPEGVGKHTLLHEIVWRLQSGAYPRPPGRKPHVWRLDPTRVIAGMSVVGMWQKRFEAIIRYLRKPEPQEKGLPDRLVIDNPVALLRIGKSAQNNMTLSDVLKPYLEKRQLQLTLIATPEQWKVIQEKDRGFSDLFQVLRLREPDLETAARILLEQRRRLELENDLTLTVQAVNQLLYIQRNYLKRQALPGSVMKLLTQLSAKYRGAVVDLPEVREEFKAFSGLEERIFDSSHQLKKGQVSRAIGRELVGQPEAVAALTDAVHLVKAKLADKSKPITSLMFIGPTGVGKTQAAKVLCQYLMGSEDHLMRFDMNEYIDPLAPQRLIGDYYQPEGQLTGKVRYRPFGVLLLDEIEKAHPAVLDLLLQVLDDGRLTDSLGRTVDFSNIIIIMTSNVGAREAAGRLGYDRENYDAGAIYRKAVENRFRPEFINRIDRIVIFNPLELEHILGIARLQIRELLRRDGFVRRTTILNIKKNALEWVARRGYDPRMGGRALKRQIERDLTTLSAEQLISNYSDQPIIFDILYRDGRLAPRIQPLDFVTTIEDNWLPNLPDKRGGRRFYNFLLRQIEDLEEAIVRHEQNRETAEQGVIRVGAAQDSKRLDWQYYDFKNKIAETKERIKTIMLGFQDRFFREAPAIPIRMKYAALVPRRDPGSRAQRENVRDRLFQEEGLRELSEAYQLAASPFDSLKTEFIDNYLNVAFLKLQAMGFFHHRPEVVTLRCRSLITGLGDAEIRFLIERYGDLFDQLDLSYQIRDDRRSIQLEGHGLREMLRGETGIHLFYQVHHNPLPVAVELAADGDPQPAAPPSFHVIRIYDGTETLTDLRTGLSNVVQLTAGEFKLLLYAGVAPDLRRRLMPIWALES